MWSLVMYIATFRLHTSSLHQAMRSTGYASPFKQDLRCNWLVFSSCDWCISILAVLVCCSFGGPLSYGSPVVVFLDRGHPCFRNFYSTIPVDVVRVKSYVNHLIGTHAVNPACVPIRITINNLYFVPKRAVSGVVIVY